MGMFGTKKSIRKLRFALSLTHALPKFTIYSEIPTWPRVFLITSPYERELRDLERNIDLFDFITSYYCINLLNQKQTGING